MTGQKPSADEQLSDIQGRLRAIESRVHSPGIENSDENGKEPSSGSQKLDNIDVINALDLRIVKSSAHEVSILLHVRAELIKQDEFVRDQRHLRQIEKLAVGAKMSLSALAVLGGIGLALGGFGLPAFVCLGAGLYGLAPNFIDAVTKRIMGPDKHD